MQSNQESLQPMLSGSDLALLHALLDQENIERDNIDIWGGSQGQITAAPNQARDVLPLYTTLPTNGETINICTNSDYDNKRDGNKLAEYRFLTFTTTAFRAYAVNITATTPTPVTEDPDDRDQSDPDIFIFRRGFLVEAGTSGNENTEEFTTVGLPAGTYVASLLEWRYQDTDGAPPDYPEQMCFDVTMTPL